MHKHCITYEIFSLYPFLFVRDIYIWLRYLNICEIFTNTRCFSYTNPNSLEHKQKLKFWLEDLGVYLENSMRCYVLNKF